MWWIKGNFQIHIYYGKAILMNPYKNKIRFLER
jgi:hypothetical protein